MDRTIEICLKLFDSIARSSTDGVQTPIQEAISKVYNDSTILLKTHKNAAIKTSTEDDVNAETLLKESRSAIEMLKQLIELTVLMCQRSASYAARVKVVVRNTEPKRCDSPSNMSQSSTSSNTSNYVCNNPISVLISLAPYWAIASMVCQDREPQTYEEIRNAISILMKSAITRDAALRVSDQVHALLLSDCGKNSVTIGSNAISPVTSVDNIRKAEKSFLRSPLLCAVMFSLTKRLDIERLVLENQRDLNANDIERLFNTSDENSIATVELVASLFPRSVLKSDGMYAQALPISHVAGFRSILPPSSIVRDARRAYLSVRLCAILSTYGASAMAIPDRTGMYPLHYAARKGHSEVLYYLAQRCSFAVPLRDSSNKTALHHALLSWKFHDEQVILYLASLCPKILIESNSSSSATIQQVTASEGQCNSFQPLLFAEKNCSSTIYSGLERLARTFRIQNKDLLTSSSYANIRQYKSRSNDTDTEVSSESEYSHNSSSNNSVVLNNNNSSSSSSGGMDIESSIDTNNSTSVTAATEAVNADSSVLFCAQSLLMLHGGSDNDEEVQPKRKTAAKKRKNASATATQDIMMLEELSVKKTRVL